jgi:4a-hydroxytetrahydrobiopterin dehydratase|tara:strand:+ start:161 stop:577 length:417 start_codon:yes stop_codon:yes gene_type:complete
VVERLVANEKVVGSSPIARSKYYIMTDLAEKKCIPCEGGIPNFDITEIHKYLKMVDGWKVEADESKIYFLLKEFKFNNFKESQEFINKVGEIAENEGHHPDIWFGWGYAKIKIFTHAIKGLHESDFVLAAKIDKLISV